MNSVSKPWPQCVAPSLAPASLASTFYPLTSAIGITQNGPPTITPRLDGDNLWDTNVTWTNEGTATLYAIYFVNLEAILNGVNGTWDNSAQEWTDANADIVKASNAAFYLTLDPSVTNLSIPPGFGLAVGDRVPAFLIASSLGPGASITTDIDLEVSPAITGLGFNGQSVGSLVPEPAGIWQLAAAVCAAWFGRRRLARMRARATA